MSRQQAEKDAYKLRLKEEVRTIDELTSLKDALTLAEGSPQMGKLSK